MAHVSSQNAILVVDDNRINRHMLNRLLSKEGYSVYQAENGAAAFEMLAKHAIDLVLLDVMMPDVNGYDVLARIRETHTVTQMPVIMVTARDQSTDIVRALDLGANDFVTKPVDFPVALARIRTHLFLKFKNELLNTLAQAQANFIATNDPCLVFGQLLTVLVGFSRSEYGFIAEVMDDPLHGIFLRIYASNGISLEALPQDIYDMSPFLRRMMNSGTTLKCDAETAKPEVLSIFQHATGLQKICLYPLSSRSEHLGLVGFANRPGGYDAELSEQLQPVWNTCSHIFSGIKSDRRQKLAEQALKTSEQRTRTILEAAVDGIIAVSGQGQIELFNPAAENIFGFKAEDVIGQNVTMLVPSSYAMGSMKNIARYLRKRQAQGLHGQELIGQRHDGSVFPMSLSVSETIQGQNALFIGIVRDITEEKKTREQIRFQSTLLECQSNASLDAILVVDSSRRWIFFNRKFLETWGFPYDLPERSKSEASLKKIVEKVENATEFVDKIQYLYNHPDESSRDEIHLKDGRILDRYSAPVQSEQGVLYGRVWYFRDITERREAEAALAQAREREIDIGSRIQKTLLLGQSPTGLSGIEVASFSLASQRIDGDFYDFFVHSDWCLDVIVGDVMGKGIPAALLGAATKSQFIDALRKLVIQSAWHTLPNPEEIVNHVHQNVTGQMGELETFVTACYARIDVERQRIDFVDCGHTKTVHYQARHNACQTLKGDNIPLGFFEDEIYAQHSMHIAPGDLLFFYSDGLTESQNEAGEFFGENRVIDLIQKNHALSPEAVLEAVRAEAYAFNQSAQFADDLTCVVVKVHERPEPQRILHKELQLQSHLENLSGIRRQIKEVFEALPDLPTDEKTVFFIQLAIQEALTNVIEHAYHGQSHQPIWIDLDFFTDAVTISIAHMGESFDPKNASPPQLDGSAEGGFGLFIMSESMDEVRYFCDDKRREVIQMTKRWLS